MGEPAGGEPAPERRPGLRHGWLGLLLIAVFWPANWLLPGLRTHLMFFPLWLGYVLAVDGLVLLRRGSSPATRSPRTFALLFVVSAPVWWLFELFNLRLGNWEYLGREHFSDLEYFLFATLSFSTVLPAVLCSAELVRSARWVERLGSGPRLAYTPARGRGYVLAGLAMLALMLFWPRHGFPLEWTWGVFALDPLAHRLGRRSFTGDLERGDWRPWVSLWLGGLMCGFFWELWNLHSYPKWIYHVPFVGFAKVFEMPALGYLGYLPFAMELWLLAWLALPRGPRVEL
jgi:hypothetical protein